MHTDIKRFYLSGQITAENFLQTRDRLFWELEVDMRDEGYVPVLDLVERSTREYNQATETFDFEFSIYGEYIGEQSWDIAGTANGRRIMMPYTQKHRSNQS